MLTIRQRSQFVNCSMHTVIAHYVLYYTCRLTNIVHSFIDLCLRPCLCYQLQSIEILTLVSEDGTCGFVRTLVNYNVYTIHVQRQSYDKVN